MADTQIRWSIKDNRTKYKLLRKIYAVTDLGKGNYSQAFRRIIYVPERNHRKYEYGLLHNTGIQFLKIKLIVLKTYSGYWRGQDLFAI